MFLPVHLPRGLVIVPRNPQAEGMKPFLFAIALLVCPPVAAQNMSASQFESYVTGKTLFYGQNGTAYGAEEYLKNRRVRWSFLDGRCQEGHWYEDGDLICFIYEENPEPQCWSFQLGPNGLIAQFVDDTPSSPLYEADNTGESMLCLGPEVGV